MEIGRKFSLGEDPSRSHKLNRIASLQKWILLAEFNLADITLDEAKKGSSRLKRVPMLIDKKNDAELAIVLLKAELGLS